MSAVDRQILRDTGLTVQMAASFMGVARQTLAKRLDSDEGDLGYRHWLDLALGLRRASDSPELPESTAYDYTNTLLALQHSLQAKKGVTLENDLPPMPNMGEQHHENQITLAARFSGWHCATFIGDDGMDLFAYPEIKSILFGDPPKQQFRQILVLGTELLLFHATLAKTPDRHLKTKIILLESPSVALLPKCYVTFEPLNSQRAPWQASELLPNFPELSPSISNTLVHLSVRLVESVRAGVLPVYRGVDFKLLPSFAQLEG